MSESSPGTGRLTIRPALSSDVAKVSGGSPPFRVRALAAEIDGRTVGVAGIVYLPGNVFAGFAWFEDDLKRNHKHALHRAALRFLSGCRDIGISTIVADTTADPASQRWLVRLGFAEMPAAVTAKLKQDFPETASEKIFLCRLTR